MNKQKIKCLFGHHNFKPEIMSRGLYAPPVSPAEPISNLHTLERCQNCLMYVKLIRYANSDWDAMIWEGSITYEDEKIIRISEHNPIDGDGVWQITKCNLDVDLL